MDVDGILLAGEPVPGQYIVKFRDAEPGVHSVFQAATMAAAVTLDYGGVDSDVLHVYTAAFSGFAVKMTRDQAVALAADPRIEYVEEDGVMHLVGTQSGATWGIDRLDEVNLALDTTYVYSTDGTNVHAYIVDSGIRSTHTEYSTRVQAPQVYVTSLGSGVDQNGHGSHVAGTVGGSTYGVAQNVKIHNVRVIGASGSGPTTDIIAGVNWVAANRITPAVMNLSIGGAASTSMDNAVQGAINAGVVSVVAAGNENQSACNSSPARLAAAITVGATNNTDARWVWTSTSGSNYGSCVDLFAPGENIKSAWYTSDTATNTITGTSMATPHVTGMAARYLQSNPSASNATVRNALVNGASSSCLSNLGTGSPNKLLNGDLAAGTCGGGGGHTINQSNLSASTGAWLYYSMVANQTPTFSISGGTGDADLYVRKGANPTTTTYNCRPYLAGNNETCNSTNGLSGSGTYYIGIRAYTTFSGVSLTGND